MTKLKLMKTKRLRYYPSRSALNYYSVNWVHECLKRTKYLVVVKI